MYVISKVTECDVVEGGEYLVSSTKDNGMIYVIDDVGDEYALYPGEWEKSKGGELGILRSVLKLYKKRMLS